VSGQIGSALILLLVLILPMTALAARRLPLRTTAIYGAAWIAIFAALWFAITLFT